jgi:hypothetical protein
MPTTVGSKSRFSRCVPTKDSNPTWPPLVADHHSPTNAADPDTKRTDAPAAPIPTAAPTHRPTPHAPHPRAPSRRPTRNPPPPTRHRRSHPSIAATAADSPGRPPPPRSRIQRLRPNFATHDGQSRHRRSVSRPAQTQGRGVPVNSLPSWRPETHTRTSPAIPGLRHSLANCIWTSPPIPGQDTHCPFRLKVARDCPACLGFAK